MADRHGQSFARNFTRNDCAGANVPHLAAGFNRWNQIGVAYSQWISLQVVLRTRTTLAMALPSVCFVGIHRDQEVRGPEPSHKHFICSALAGTITGKHTSTGITGGK